MLRLATGIIFLLAAVISFAYFDYSSAGPLTQDSNVILPRGKGFKASVDALAEAGVISHPLLFRATTFINGDARRFKAGEYHFSAGVSARAVAAMLVSGQVIVHKITVAEGLKLREVFDLLRAETVLEGDLPANITEGSLLPETYHFTYGDTRASVVARMQESARRALANAWEKRAENLPYTSPEQALIMASIIEKETGVAQERSHIASIFLNRMKRGMKLQSDPTTVYGIEVATGKPLGRALTIDDLQAPTPYNTYTIDGLPPGPIANPGKASIEAALHPDATDDLYFVATGNGGHHFSSTLEQHNKNVAAYRAAKKQQ